MIAPPPRDEDGVKPHDHPEIKNSHEIIRRINELWVKNGRISSMAYQKSSDKNGGMSVDLKQLIEADGKDPVEFVTTTTPRLAGAVVFKVADVRGLEFQVGYDPIMESPSNLYHGEVWGNFSKGQVKQLRQKAQWFVPIPNVNVA